MRKIFALIVVAGLMSFSPPSWSSEPIVVTRHQIDVIDGDTIVIGKMVYQLAGIDAPELGQACDNDGHLWLCGLAAGYALRKQLDLEVFPIHCFIQARPKGLPIAACLFGDVEVSVNLLKGGYVTAAPDGPPHYAAAEHSAKKGSLGIWGSKFIAPWEWRDGKRLPNEHEFKESSHPTADFPWKDIEAKFLHLESEHAACMVKGVITANNQRFYFGPLDRQYGSIAIDPKKGERFFCGDDDARKAGWRRQGEALGTIN